MQFAVFDHPKSLHHQKSILFDSLDILTEKKIIDNLMKLNKTIIFIAHRLTIAEKSEKVIVLDQGKLIEQGTHKELLTNQGFYYNLVNY